MSKLWDDLKDNMKDWSKFDIHQLYKEMNKVYEDLGKLAYKHTKNEHIAAFSGNKDFFNLVNKIEELKMKIEVKEKEINDIKEEYGVIDSDNDKNIIEDIDDVSAGEQTAQNFDDDGLDS